MELDVIYNEDVYQGIKKIPDKSIDLVYIDIPYDMNYSGSGFLKNNTQNVRKEMNKNKETLLKGIDYKLLDDLCRVMKRIYIYIWCSKSQIYKLMEYFIEKKKCNFNILCWCKDNPVPFGNSPFLSDIEYCLVFYESGAIFNRGIENKHKWYLSNTNKKDKELFDHPTIKPLDFVKMNLLNSTKENDIVLDCFIGSGTTAVACKELGRHYIGFEINPKYYQIATDRLNGITKKDREKKESGQMSLF